MRISVLFLNLAERRLGDQQLKDSNWEMSSFRPVAASCCVLHKSNALQELLESVFEFRIQDRLARADFEGGVNARQSTTTSLVFETFVHNPQHKRHRSRDQQPINFSR